jgi:hypothetical protein
MSESFDRGRRAFWMLPVKNAEPLKRPQGVNGSNIQANVVDASIAYNCDELRNDIEFSAFNEQSLRMPPPE